MPARKMRVELFDTDGNKYSISFEGQVTRDKALRLIDLVELLGGATNERAATANVLTTDETLSKYDKLHAIIRKNFPLVWFSSRETQVTYERELREPISLSTVATYLSRMTDKGFVVRTGAGNDLKYRVTPNLSALPVKQRITA